MKYQTKNGQLQIETTAYQAKNGGIYLDWGSKPILLDRFPAEQIAMDIPDFSVEDFKSFYK